jgi:hypothetical protein
VLVSSHGDWQWTFPESGVNRTEFISRNYFSYETDPQCNHYCCLGATGSGGGGVKPSFGCQAIMDLTVEFSATSKRKIFSLVDVILLARKLPTPKYNLSIAFSGDSVTGQTFYGAVCELVRNKFVEYVEINHVTYDLDPDNDNRKSWQRQIELVEAKVHLHGDPDSVSSSIVFVKMYKMIRNPFAITAIFKHFDVSLR